ncbi:MAG: hypothetical protein WC405_09000 [Syntrophales bacterium]
MNVAKNVSLIISLPKKYRDLLRKMAAEKNLTNQDTVCSAARLGREIIINHVDSTDGKYLHNEDRSE